MNSVSRLLGYNSCIRGIRPLQWRSAQPTMRGRKQQTVAQFGTNRGKEFGRNKRRKNKPQASSMDEPQSSLEQKQSNRNQLLFGSLMTLGLWGVCLLAYPPQQREDNYTQELRTFGGKIMRKPKTAETETDGDATNTA